MRYGRSIVLAGLLMGLAGLAPVGVSGLLGVTQTIAQTTEQRKEEADRLFRQGDYQIQDRNIEAAIHSYQKSLEIYQEIKDNRGQVTVLRFLGEAYSGRNFEVGVKYVRQSLILAQKVRDDYGESQALMALSDINTRRAKYAEAVKYAQQAWRVAQQIENSNNRYLAQSSILIGLIQLYYQLGNEAKANEYGAIAQKLDQQDRSIRMQDNQNGEIDKLLFTASNYEMRGEHIRAISCYEKVVILAPKSSYPLREVVYLGTIGDIYLYKLNNPGKAIKYYEQQLAAKQKIPGTLYRSAGLLGLGYAYAALGNSAKAFEYFNKLLTAARENGERSDEYIALSVLAGKYFQIGNYAKAIEYYRQKISFAYEGKDDRSIMFSYLDLGAAYRAEHNYLEAIGAYQRALSITQEKSDRRHETLALEKIGELYKQQNQPELAIVFYKQSVNVIETIRQDIRQLPRESQESYTQTIAGTYRALADLLIAQGRIGEAQQVLERLKIQELNDFTKGTRAAAAIPEVGFNPAETQIKGKHISLIAFGGKYYDCEQQRCPQYRELRDQYESLSKEFQAFVEQIKQQLRDSRLTQVDKFTQEFLNSADRIVTAHPNSILIYPLVLPDKTRLLWASKGGVLSKTAICPLGEKALYSKVSDFQRQLRTPGDPTQLKAIGKDLYDCLIKPIEGELTANQIKHLIFVPDRATNYIPMGALFDGKQYLIQRFAVSNILSIGLTDTDDKPKTLQQTSVLALGLTQAKGNFGALPNVEAELNAIVKQKDGTGIYSGNEYIDQAFTKAALEDNIRGHSIIHIATHGEFKPADPRTSYFLLGTGKPYLIPDIQTLRELKDVHLVVLSACETGLGGADGLGLEVSGISSFFMGDRDKAKAVMASLWQVNDASTSLLMQQFYKNLATGKTKVEALQQAQLSLLNGEITAKNAPDRAGARRYIPGQPPVDSFAHPYYWAPFILIGNGR